VVPGAHDAEELARMAEFAAGLDGEPAVRLIPFHRIGESKYEALGRPRPEFADAPLPALLETAREAFRQAGARMLSD